MVVGLSSTIPADGADVSWWHFCDIAGQSPYVRFRKFGHRLIDWIADYRGGVAERPVVSRVKPGNVKAQLPAEAPQQAESFDSILADVERIIMPGLSHWQHPGFFAYFPSNSLP